MTKTYPDATGKVQWMGTAANGNRLLNITPVHVDGKEGERQTYEVNPVEGGYDLHTAKPTGEFVCYHVRHHAGLTYTCDCPDAKHRRGTRCKHVKGLFAALKREPF